MRITLGPIGSDLLVLFSYADHPRFGRIRSISALHDMEPGEEVTTDYRLISQREGGYNRLQVNKPGEEDTPDYRLISQGRRI